MINEIVTAFARHGLGVLGTILVAKGYLTPEDQTSFVNSAMDLVGAAGVVGAFVWSIWHKIQANKKLLIAKANSADPNIGGV